MGRRTVSRHHNTFCTTTRPEKPVESRRPAWAPSSPTPYASRWGEPGEAREGAQGRELRAAQDRRSKGQRPPTEDRWAAERSQPPQDRRRGEALPPPLGDKGPGRRGPLRACNRRERRIRGQEEKATATPGPPYPARHGAEAQDATHDWRRTRTPTPPRWTRTSGCAVYSSPQHFRQLGRPCSVTSGRTAGSGAVAEVECDTYGCFSPVLPAVRHPCCGLSHVVVRSGRWGR